MSHQIVSYQSTVSEIGNLFTAGVSAWRKAGELLVALYDADINNRAKVQNDLKHLPVGVLSTLERIGRKRVVAEVCINSGPGWRKLQRMPYDVQAVHVEKPVELLVLNGDKADVLMVHVSDMSKDQAEQVFAASEIRSPAAQRAFLAERKSKAAPTRVDESWRIGRESLTVLRPCEITRKQLSAILAQMG